MNIVELQIRFQQKIEDVNPGFADQARPDTFTIAEYLNKSIDKYLENKYLNLPSFEHRLVMIEQNLDELQKLIKEQNLTGRSLELSNFNWGARGKNYYAPQDILTPISISVTVSRNEVMPMADQLMFGKFVSRRQAERIINNAVDKVIFKDPMVLWQNGYYIMIIGDAYVSSITDPRLTYLRNPFPLSFEYSEITTEGTNNIQSIPDGGYFITHSYCQYVDSGGSAAFYEAGSKVQKIAGYDTVTKVTDDLRIGYPYGYIDIPEFPEYTHESLLDRAVSLFLDEAKLKLIPRSNDSRADAI